MERTDRKLQRMLISISQVILELPQLNLKSASTEKEKPVNTYFFNIVGMIGYPVTY